ncbi:MAG TPA: hypothetical protein VKP65_18635 [Rhodothermales bacterium]|nr:hypothetical protein [Rhodothermales bacterium]
MQINWRIVVEIIEALAWPIVVAFALYLFRRPLIELVGQVARRAKRLTVYSVSIDLATMGALTPSWSAGSVDVRQLSPSHVFDSFSGSLFNELLDPREVHYAVIDLGSGDKWLTSRLFIFAYVLEQAKGLRAFAFLEQAGGVRRRFLGVAAPADVQRVLASRYPWLEEALIRARALQAGAKPAETAGQTTFNNGPALFAGTDQHQIVDFVRNYVEDLQRTTVPPADEMESYQNIGTAPETWERTHWIDGERLERDLMGVLRDTWCEDSPDIPRRHLVESILIRKGPYVALVDEDRRFRGLVDRHALLDQVWEDRELSKANTSES